MYFEPQTLIYYVHMYHEMKKNINGLISEIKCFSLNIGLT